MATGSAFKPFLGIRREGLRIDTKAPMTLRPDHHIFVGSKAEWDEIRDGLPEFEGHAR